jgi:MraZ protein
VKAFIGTFVNKIDAKGRISVPASFRTVIQAKGLNGVALYPSPVEECIEGCGMDRIETLVEAMRDEPLPSIDQDSVAHLVIGSARESPFDSGGRIVLPDDFIRRAKLDGQGAFVGKGRTFQIWRPEALKAAQDELAKRVLEARRRQMTAAADGPR